ncbi:MAG: TIGR00730 family Rossman fold protein [Clostridiales bacterium]|nr:TIGR00730 family Rossman fold protein [Clostridiales bacterium]MBQ3323004.1 TIGR00730 family Rossman fold protein [Bacillota bacterium]
MNITVYLGAYEGNDNTIRDAVRELGTWIGESGNTLVYGGSKIGLMGVLAESVIRSGGKAIGVEPQFLIDQVLQYDELTELIVTENMSQRKAKMIELGDAFIALPGGTGTLEEISEIMSNVSLRLIDAPCILYNHNGYYDNLKQQLAKMIEIGLSSEERQAGICFADSIEQIKGILSE